MLFRSIHGDAISQDGHYSFTSANISYLAAHRAELSEYKLIDIIYGVQQEVMTETLDILDAYCRQGGRVLLSGSDVYRAAGFRCPALGLGPSIETLADRNSGVSGSGV